jgi:hypothetical protein
MRLRGQKDGIRYTLMVGVISVSVVCINDRYNTYFPKPDVDNWTALSSSIA